MTYATEPDLGPLTWVKNEIDLALARADESLGLADGAPDGAAAIRDDLLVFVRERVDLLLRDILTRQKHMLVQWHGFSLSFGFSPAFQRKASARASLQLRKGSIVDSVERRHHETGILTLTACTAALMFSPQPERRAHIDRDTMAFQA